MRTRTKVMSGLIAAAAAAGAFTFVPQAFADAGNCEGSAVRRCVTLQTTYEGGSYYIRGFANIRDTSGGVNYSVAVSNLRLELYTSNGWRLWAGETDYDGWHGTYESVANRSYTFCNGKYRAKAVFKWKRAGSTSYSQDSLMTGTVTC